MGSLNFYCCGRINKRALVNLVAVRDISRATKCQEQKRLRCVYVCVYEAPIEREALQSPYREGLPEAPL